MTRPFALLSVLIALTRSASATESPSVVVAFSEPELELVARRVQAELWSAGRENVILESRVPLGTCTSRPATEDTRGQVGIILQTEPGGVVRAELCAKPEANQTTIVTAQGRVDRKADFAIIVTEALHGLLIAPLPSEQQERPQVTPPPSPSEPQSEKRASSASPPSVSVGAGIVLDVPTGGYWAGVLPEIRVPVGGRFALEGDFLIGFHPISYSDDLVDLKSHLAWARFGLVRSSEVGPFVLGWNFSGGLFSNRAKANAVSPRQGGSDGAFGAVFGAGTFAEFPAKGAFFLSGSLGLSTLVPRLNYRLSGTPTPEVGALLLEGGLGLGLRLE